MHCLLKFDVAAQCVDETDPKILERMKELIAEYNAIPADDEHKDEQKAKWRILVASLPEGFCLAATMVTNYQQLKTMFMMAIIGPLLVVTIRHSVGFDEGSCFS